MYIYAYMYMNIYTHAYTHIYKDKINSYEKIKKNPIVVWK